MSRAHNVIYNKNLGNFVYSEFNSAFYCVYCIIILKKSNKIANNMLCKVD